MDRRSADDDRARRDRLLRQAGRGEFPAKPESKRPPDSRDVASTSARSSGGPATQSDPPKPRAVSSYRSTPGQAVEPPYPSRVDLHTHSRRSDGVLEPAELVAQAAAVGVRVLALADHDTVAGVRDLLAPGKPALPLDLLPAVEINSIASGFANLPEGELHILGLGVDIHD